MQTELAETRSALEQAHAQIAALEQDRASSSVSTAELGQLKVENDELKSKMATIKVRQADVVDRYFDNKTDEDETQMVKAIEEMIEGPPLRLSRSRRDTDHRALFLACRMVSRVPQGGAPEGGQAGESAPARINFDAST